MLESIKGMNDLKKIKDIYNVSDDFLIKDEKFDTWLKKLLNKTEEEIDINDVNTMFTQHELEDLAIKKAIEFILDDPLAGEMWDGQFLEQLAKEPVEKLEVHKEVLEEMPAYIDNYINDSMWDFGFEKEEFMARYDQFKKVVYKL